MTDEKTIFEDSPESATLETVTGWMSRDGRFFGDDRKGAQLNGATHRKCEDCGATIKMGRLRCEECGAKREREWYENLPEEDWDGVAMIYSRTLDRYFWDVDSVRDYCDDEGCSPEDLQLLICEPIYLREVDLIELNEDNLPESDFGNFCFEDLPEEVQDAVVALNKAIEKNSTPKQAISWGAGSTRLRRGTFKPYDRSKQNEIKN